MSYASNVKNAFAVNWFIWSLHIKSRCM